MKMKRKEKHMFQWNMNPILGELVLCEHLVTVPKAHYSSGQNVPQ